MKNLSSFFASCLLVALAFCCSCNSVAKPPNETPATDSVAANVKLYTHVWDEIINHGNLAMFNDSNFTKDVVMHANPDIVGIDSAKAYYANYVNGFSNIRFTMKDVFGQGNKLVKHWNFSGTNTGVFFGIPPTGKSISIDGVTLVRMAGGKIAEERDFFDNLDFLQQMGLMPKK